MRAPYTIIVSSQKGGVGKTVISVNLASALAASGYKVLLLDMAFMDPCVGLSLDILDKNRGVCSVLLGKESIKDIAMKHKKLNLLVVPCELESNIMKMSPDEMTRGIASIYQQLKQLGCDFIVIDTAPAIYINMFADYFKAFERADAMVVLTPEMSACISAIRLDEHIEKAKLRHLFVVNRVRNAKYELDIKEIEDTLGEKVVAMLPEDENNMEESESSFIPMCIARPKSPFSKAIFKLSEYYVSKAGLAKGANLAPWRALLSTLGRFLGAPRSQAASSARAKPKGSAKPKKRAKRGR